METIQKIRVARDVLNAGKKIAETATKHGVSKTTVRNYMDQYCDGKLQIDVTKELAALRIHTYLATTDKDQDTLKRRLAYIDETMVAILDQAEKQS